MLFSINLIYNHYLGKHILINIEEIYFYLIKKIWIKKY